MCADTISADPGWRTSLAAEVGPHAGRLARGIGTGSRRLIVQWGYPTPAWARPSDALAPSGCAALEAFDKPAGSLSGEAARSYSGGLHSLHSLGGCAGNAPPEAVTQNYGPEGHRFGAGKNLSFERGSGGAKYSPSCRRIFLRPRRVGRTIVSTLATVRWPLGRVCSNNRRSVRGAFDPKATSRPAFDLDCNSSA